MTQKDQNTITMWRTVRRFLDENLSIWSANQPFESAYEDLQAAIGRASAAQQSQVTRTVGLTQDKDELEEIALDKIDAITRSVRAYALTSKNHTLEAAVQYGKGPLSNLPQLEQVKVMRSIVAAAAQHDAALAPYSVTAADRTAALAAIDAYESAQPAARTSVATKSAATQSIPAILKAGREALRLMDNLTHIFNAPAFAAGYKTARVVVHSGTRHDKPDDTKE